MLFTDKGLVRKDMKQGNGRVTHWWASGYTRLPKRMRGSTIAPARWNTRCTRDPLSLNKTRPWANMVQKRPAVIECQRVCAKAPYTPQPPPPPLLPFSAFYKGLLSCTCALSSVWATSPGPDPWGFFQLDHFILHPKLLVIGWLL